MDKEKILEASRRENNRKDLVEAEVVRSANSCAAVVGGVACCVILTLASILAQTMLYSPWFIYFSMLGANWCVRAIKTRRKSDWGVTGAFVLLAIAAIIGFIVRVLGVGV